MCHYFVFAISTHNLFYYSVIVAAFEDVVEGKMPLVLIIIRVWISFSTMCLMPHAIPRAKFRLSLTAGKATKFSLSATLCEN